MLGISHGRTVIKVLLTTLLIILLGLGSIGTLPSEAALFKDRSAKSGQANTKLAGKISEASPPEVIQELRQVLDEYQPQVAIVSPKSNEVLTDNTVSIRFQVKDLPLFKNETFGLGPHLHVFLDNQPYQAVYDASKPLVLIDLAPGTHSLRVFASRPWHESFKNEGAYAQTTFHVFTKTQENSPNPDLPLLTYSRPQGSYGAEPIMLDFYLTNAPLHLVAQESSKDEIADWRIRVNVNGDSFVLDRWQPIYLKGFKPGKNWVQLEFLDEKGNLVSNVFNNTARLITYEPNGKDALAKLVRGDVSAAEARGIVDPNYVPAAPEPIPSPEVAPTPVASPSPAPTPTPAIEPKPSLEPVSPIPVIPPAVDGPTLDGPTLDSPTLDSPTSENPAIEPPSEETQPKRKGWFKSRPKAIEPVPVIPSPEPAASPSQEETSESTQDSEAVEESSPEDGKAMDQVDTADDGQENVAPVPEPKPKSGFFNRFRRSANPPSASPVPLQTAPPELLPTTEPDASPSETAEPEISLPPSELPPSENLSDEKIPPQLTAPEDQPTPERIYTQPAAAKTIEQPSGPRNERLGEKSSFTRFAARFRRPAPSPTVSAPPDLPPTLPEIIDETLPEEVAPAEPMPDSAN